MRGFAPPSLKLWRTRRPAPPQAGLGSLWRQLRRAEKLAFPFRRKNGFDKLTTSPARAPVAEQSSLRGRQNQKSRENFFAGWRALASGGGATRQFRSK